MKKNEINDQETSKQSKNQVFLGKKRELSEDKLRNLGFYLFKFFFFSIIF